MRPASGWSRWTRAFWRWPPRNRKEVCLRVIPWSCMPTCRRRWWSFGPIGLDYSLSASSGDLLKKKFGRCYLTTGPIGLSGFQIWLFFFPNFWMFSFLLPLTRFKHRDKRTNQVQIIVKVTKFIWDYREFFVLVPFIILVLCFLFFLILIWISYKT